MIVLGVELFDALDLPLLEEVVVEVAGSSISSGRLGGGKSVIRFLSMVLFSIIAGCAPIYIVLIDSPVIYFTLTK